MVRRLLEQQPQHRFAVKPAQLNQLIHQDTLLLIAQDWVAAPGSLQKLLAPLTLGSTISRCRALHKKNIQYESTNILRVTGLTSQRASRINRQPSAPGQKSNPYSSFICLRSRCWKLEMGVLHMQRKDRSQDNVLRAWVEAVFQQFDVQVLPFAAETARRCAVMHIPDAKGCAIP
jgi:hypothetical protein